MVCHLLWRHKKLKILSLCLLMILWCIVYLYHVMQNHFYPNRLLNARTTCVTCVANGSFSGFRAKIYRMCKMVNKKSSPTFLRVHEVDFGSMVPIDNDKPKTFCASQIRFMIILTIVHWFLFNNIVLSLFQLKC